MTSKMIETYRGVAHPWLCDVNEHLNVRHYVSMFDDAGFHFLGILGHRAAEMATARKGWADVKAEILYRDEVPRGGLVVIRTGVVTVGGKSLTYRHGMHAQEDDRLHATMTVVSVHFDLDARKAIPLPEGFEDSVARYRIEEA